MTRRLLISVAALFLVCSFASASAGQPVPGVTDASLTFGGLISIQPPNEKLEGGPYLDGTIGGSPIGILGALTFSNKTTSFSVELTTTMAMTGELDGRLIPGDGPVLATHRDSLFSFLYGYRQERRSGWITYKGGPSLVWSRFRFDNEPLADSLSHRGFVAFTGGIDAGFTKNQVSIVPFATYSHIFRGDERYFLGVGNHVVRAGVGIRFGL